MPIWPRVHRERGTNNRFGFVCLARCPALWRLRKWDMTEKSTVRTVTYDLLRSLSAGTTTVIVVRTQPQKAML